MEELETRLLGWSYEDYLIKEINPEYGYYLYCTVHKPIPAFLKSSSLEDRMWKICVHRHLPNDSVVFEEQWSKGDSEIVYKGLVENNLEEILRMVGVLKQE